MNTAKQVVNPLRELSSYGQSVWLDFIRRSLLNSGELKRLVDEDGLKGMTSNPAIFEKAIAGSNDYADALAILKKDSKLKAMDIYEHIAVEDIQQAADILKPVYEKTQKRDGYVSMEVSPFLANDTEKTIEEAKRLWKWVNRPNVMIKVPATKAGIPAIKELIALGININVTLLFSQEAYEAVHWAYIDGLETFQKSGGDLSSVASVASFFVSRIDTLIDSMIEEKLKTAQGDEKSLLNKVLGKVAIANAKQAYQKYLQIIADARWKDLAKHGAQTQRLLWASTSTKNPAFPDCIYVDELIGKDTVNTIPPSTFDAFRDHGVLKNTLEADVADANAVMENLEKCKISMKEVTDKLVVQGVDLFADAFKKLLDTVEKSRTTEPKSLIDNLKYELSGDLNAAVDKTVAAWQSKDNMKKLWSRDASLWTGEDESKWLDWLNIINDQLAHIDNLKKLSQEIKDAKFKYALLLGMGGSSLCPDVLRMTFPKEAGYPELHVLDSTDPQQVKAAEKAIDVKQTIFIVSSKSGTTLEPNIFEQYFWQKTVEAVGADKAGQHWIAVTDPGSKLQALAEKEKFRHIFLGLPGIGGRYSALSNFGMVPAAVMGLDVSKFLDRSREMAHACAATVPVKENPGAVLGIIMGEAAKAGRDKITIITSAKIKYLGAWLEQLIAESTGKIGKGIIPVDREAIAAPETYGKDRLFVYLRVETGANEVQDKAIDALEKAGHPMVKISVTDIYNLGEEFFRWEIATAVAGAVIGINAFNQPDVEASKVATRELTEAYEKAGKLPEEKPFFEGDGIKLFADEKNAKEIGSKAGVTPSLNSIIKAHLSRVKDGDYVALLAYIEMTEAHETELQVARLAIRDSKKVATCLGFGPRFLHSTGQAYKGGPNRGVFIQVTADDTEEVPVPQQKYTFGVVKAAQARGDLKVLNDRGRRALRVHLSKDVAKGWRARVEGGRGGGKEVGGRRRVSPCFWPGRRMASPLQKEEEMQLGMVGLGRMGANMVRRLMAGGHECVVYDRNPEPAKELAKEGATAADSYKDLISKLAKPRAVWVMVPSGKITDDAIQELSELLEAGDTIIDGGNSYFKDDVRRAHMLKEKGITFADCGTSGGVWGKDRGYCLMVGAEKQVFQRLEPIFATLAPGVGDTPITPGREKMQNSAEQGYIHAGPAGAGHYVKMVHNGIEYGLMQAYAEGFSILASADSHELPEDIRYDINLADVAEVWRRGSVVGSWLLDLTSMALCEDKELESYTGFVQDSGEGRWTIQAAIEQSVPAEVLSAALYTRFRSRLQQPFGERLLSAMRFKFGGHLELKPNSEMHRTPAKSGASS